MKGQCFKARIGRPPLSIGWDGLASQKPRDGFGWVGVSERFGFRLEINVLRKTKVTVRDIKRYCRSGGAAEAV